MLHLLKFDLNLSQVVCFSLLQFVKKKPSCMVIAGCDLYEYEALTWFHCDRNCEPGMQSTRRFGVIKTMPFSPLIISGLFKLMCWSSLINCACIAAHDCAWPCQLSRSGQVRCTTTASCTREPKRGTSSRVWVNDLFLIFSIFTSRIPDLHITNICILQF